MSKEQPNLFFEDENKDYKSNIDKQKLINTSNKPFLPGIKDNEYFVDINYEELKQKALSCQKCGLRANCQKVVFGTGDINSKIMFIGEGPGQEEDNQGIPFVGRAGQLLDKILKAAELERQAIYITNVVKCRPPNNRLPSPDEVKACRGFLETQIKIIKPQLIVCLGSKASQVVIDPKVKITQIRGQWFIREGIRIIATYHPAALLRNEDLKRPTWQDFKKIRDYYQELLMR